MPFMEERCFKIKAYISTLTSKLTSGQGEAWTLACKINDGSMAMDVDLSNTVLTGLIGFSAQDSIIMRKQARTDSSIKDVLLEGIQQCQQKLVDLSCILEIKVKAHSIRPMITQIINIKNQHLQSLLQRVERKLTVI
ncbi:hypothetical protein SNE40_019087 [Patella caerulea]|uniref:RecQ-mediated genome instability protein 1 C-terminal OB-fold domain-containing protein n=1 Tax=Patella caerulea TaxID=87958 RepID=A0AAN8J613_PATCE